MNGWTRVRAGVYYRDGFFIKREIVHMKESTWKSFRDTPVWVLWRPIQRGERKGELDTVGWNGTRRTPPIYFRKLSECKKFAAKVIGHDRKPWIGAKAG